MKVIFLDFDGVLNSVEWWRRRGADGMRSLDPAAVGLVNQLVVRTDAKVVISSTWRLFPKDVAVNTLKENGFVGEIIGQTPDGAMMKGAIYGAVQRGHEIQAWLATCPKVSSFVILDDDSDMAHLSDRLVLTSHAVGLTQANVDSAVLLLGGPPPKLLEGR